jgi:hypothetical protein
MPQLGMAQDAGLIVAWHKKPGDAVASDDVLMEVETDKAVMEVPAGVDGFLAEIRAEAGTEVPIGNVIAVISDSADGAVAQAKPEASAVETPAPPPAAQIAEPEPETQASRPAPAQIEASDPSGRILASPKAKFVAHQRGIDLQALVDQGVPQPFHLADLDLVAAPAAGGRQAAAASAIETPSTLSASANRSGFDTLMQMPGLEEVSPSLVFGAFAASAYRQIAGDRNAPIVVQCRAIPGETATLSNPDNRGLSQLGHDDAAAAPGILVHDMTRSRLAGYRPGSGTGADLQISISADGEKGFDLTLAFSEARLTLEDAAAFFEAFLNRVENPIQHIV